MNQLTNLISNFFPIDENGAIRIFGILIYIDDLLIIAILLLLYRENVSDYFIYIALILLLMS